MTVGTPNSYLSKGKRSGTSGNSSNFGVYANHVILVTIEITEFIVNLFLLYTLFIIYYLFMIRFEVFELSFKNIFTSEGFWGFGEIGRAHV